MKISEGTYMIGRTSSADILLPEAATAASRVHAELIVTDKGRLYLVDRNSTNGTWTQSADGWKKLTQDYVQPEDWVIFGDYGVKLSELLPQIVTRQPEKEPEVAPQGRPKRNPETGEIYYV